MATTLRQHLPHRKQERLDPQEGRERIDREPVVLADALGDVMAALTEVDPDLLDVSVPRE